MTARVLVVDDILANVKLLEARLSAEYFEVLTAHNGREALQVLGAERIDVVLLDVMMPGMDGFEVCRRIKADPRTMHLPVVMITALDQPTDKIQGLRVGADDFLAKPVDDIGLITRVRNLARLKALNDEMLLRMASGAEIGLVPGAGPDLGKAEAGARILLVEDQERAVQRVVAALTRMHTVDQTTEPREALARLGEGACDLLIVSLSLVGADGLRLCSQVRSLERLRHLPIMVVAEPTDEQRLLRALDMGVNDYLIRPIDRHELIARVRTQIRRKRHSDFLRNSLSASLELAVMDALTGLFNRRYLETHAKALTEKASRTGSPLSVLVVDIDHFKSVNDTYGHAAGDSVLREFAQRLRRNTRGVDLVCRMGGEEFIIVMPDTPLWRARQVAERLLSCIAAEPFRVSAATQVPVTASVGLAALEIPGEGMDALFGRADRALYAAKREGRNRVVANAA
ncbi:MAG: PleD family two-component system response regulator [Hyphomonadaceae bacterium]|jgi:two-component system cell cycle response regulator|nr:PleD family two-component system response regulator [Hyphomonadaceae bacterium]